MLVPSTMQVSVGDQVVVLPDGADAKGWYVSLSRAREAMHVYTRDKAELRQSVMQPGPVLARLNHAKT